MPPAPLPCGSSSSAGQHDRFRWESRFELTSHMLRTTISAIPSCKKLASMQPTPQASTMSRLSGEHSPNSCQMLCGAMYASAQLQWSTGKQTGAHPHAANAAGQHDEPAVGAAHRAHQLHQHADTGGAATAAAAATYVLKRVLARFPRPAQVTVPSSSHCLATARLS